MKTLQMQISPRSVMLTLADIIISPIIGVVVGAIAATLIYSFYSILVLLPDLLNGRDLRMNDVSVGLIIMTFLGGFFGLPIGTVLGIFHRVINRMMGTRIEWVIIAGLSSGLAAAWAMPQRIEFIVIFAVIGVIEGVMMAYVILRLFGQEMDRRTSLQKWVGYLLSIPLMTAGIYVVLQLVLSSTFD